MKLLKGFDWRGLVLIALACWVVAGTPRSAAAEPVFTLTDLAWTPLVELQYLQGAPTPPPFELAPPQNPLGSAASTWPQPGPAGGPFPVPDQPPLPAWGEAWESSRPVVVDGGPQPHDPFSDDGLEMGWDSPSRMTWVIGDRDGLGWFSLEDQGALGYWGPEGFGSMLGYSIHFLEGPERTDLPPRLYGLHYGLRWRDRVTECWGYEVAVAPGVYSDFEDSAREGLRVQGHGFVMWTLDVVQFVLGIDYLDRDTIKLLPIAGFVWEPSDATRIELVFPRPRIARLVGRNQARDRWLYVGAEYGGDSWAVERTTGFADVVTLNEIQITFGLESDRFRGRSSGFEIGLHVDRELEFRSGAGNFRPTNTFAFRWGSRF